MNLRFARAAIRVLVLASVILVFLTVNIAAVWATADLKITVTDPRRQGVQVYDGSTINTPLDTPTVYPGDNRKLGTLRISGKSGLSEPVRPGDQVKVTLPYGACYMAAPDNSNFRDYVQWPSVINGQHNKLVDTGEREAVRFISGDRRSITVEIANVEAVNPVMALDFTYDKPGTSAVRVSGIMDKVEALQSNPEMPVTRLEFFSLLSGATVPFGYGMELDELKNPGDLFADVKGVDQRSLNSIAPLVSTGAVVGNPGGRLRPLDPISRWEAIALVGRIFPTRGDTINAAEAPMWARPGVANALAYRVVDQIPDNPVIGSGPLTGGEALRLIQRVLESYKAQS